jgi:hypothetical protein
MNRYVVTATVTLDQVVPVDAESPEKAKEIAELRLKEEHGKRLAHVAFSGVEQVRQRKFIGYSCQWCHGSHLGINCPEVDRSYDCGPR